MSASVESAALDPMASRRTDFSARRAIALVPPVAVPSVRDSPVDLAPVHLPPAATNSGPFLPRPMLTQREIQVLTGWIRCDSKPAVAKSLFLSLGTVNTHLTRIRAKYAAVGRPASTKASLVARALQDGHIDIADL